jgi:ATP-dependent metalloprotease FtsH
VGAARVRDLFEQAKKSAPCIIFIDELDALGKTRQVSPVGGNDEKEQTLNQLLVEMDGFDTTGGIIILAATIRPELIDPALLRAGRFDRQVVIDRPDKKGREDILRIHVKNVKVETNLKLEEIASMTVGFSGADLANLVNEAALIATREQASLVNLVHFTLAHERIVAGLEKKNRLLTAKEKKIVAFHEMGHAIVGRAYNTDEKIHKVSIIPHGMGSMGHTIQTPLEDHYIITKDEIKNKLIVLMAGRAAESLIFQHFSTGAADDLMKAMAGGDPNSQYRSSHFDEPNILAHLRMSDRVTDGKKTLLVDEVQSDWHQAARDKRTIEIENLIANGMSQEEAQKAVPKDFGYDKPLSNELVVKERKMRDELRQLQDKYLNLGGLEFEPSVANQKEYAEIGKKIKELQDDLRAMPKAEKKGVPDAPYKDDYYQLALRRAVKEAIDGGYDRVALPTGSRVAERFSLTKHINELHYSGSNLKAYDHNGKEVISQTGVRPEDLPSYVGREIANKLLEQPKQGTLRSLVGQDLTIGDEGMKKYYDEIYPTYLKKFGKKYGASVGTTYAKTDIQEWPFPIQIESDGKNFWLFGQDPRIDKKAKLSSNFSSYEDANKFRDSMYEGNTEPLHYMDITPAMRKEFSTGIHMKKGGKVSFASNIDAMRHELNKRQ